jgi:hypothetical protein
MARLSKTILTTKDEDILYKFFKRYEGRDDLTRTIDLNPDKNGYKTCTITYHPERLNDEINKTLYQNNIIKIC